MVFARSRNRIHDGPERFPQTGPVRRFVLAHPLTNGYSDSGAARTEGTRWSGEPRWSYSSRSGGTNRQSRWTGGPFVELHLPYRLGVEFSVITRTSTENSTLPFPFGTNLNPYLAFITDKVRTWDFPLLLKYRFTEGKFRPFVGAGAAWSIGVFLHGSARLVPLARVSE